MKKLALIFLLIIFSNSIAFAKQPEIEGIEEWINSKPLTLKDLKGKVVLIDFWTYSCINCVRTLPYLKKWDQQYKDKGLVIIGVSSPEFEFEKVPENVKKAVERYGIKYAVALDNEMKTWDSFKNRYWPAKYLINKDGEIVYSHFGEGGYAETEVKIMESLGLKGEVKEDEKTGGDLSQTPETYLGYQRAANLSNLTQFVQDEVVDYKYAEKLDRDHWTLNGSWKIEGQKSVAQQAGAGIKLSFYSQKVYLVMGSSSGKPVKAKISLNGGNAGKLSGKDVKNGEITVDSNTLYELLDLKDSDSGVIEITAEDAGLEVYAFTFGK